MELDLRKCSKVIQEHIVQRVRDYPKCANEGPGEAEDPVTQITIGYQFDQSGWLALVFDTRAGATPDGEWNSFIEQNAREFDEWYEAFHDLGENGSPSRITLPDGSRRTLRKDTSVEQFAECLGTMIRDVLISARDKGDLAALPLAPQCTIVVEEQDGYYGWSNRETAGPGSDSDYLAQLEGDVSSKSTGGQTAHWIQVLERIASGKEAESDWSFLAPDHAIQRLRELGDPAVVPLLKFVRKWAGRPEFDGDRPKRNVTELPMQTPTIGALMMVRESGYRTRETELLLRDIVRRSVKANVGRRLWGIVPMWGARCLFGLFEGYPEPEQNDRTNELMNRNEFTKKGLIG